MEYSGDKFASLIIPNCHRTSSQDEKLQSCPFSRQSKASSDNIQSSSSPDDSSEQVTGIEMLTLPDSFDEYETPPEQDYSHNSINDRGIIDFDRLDDEIVDLGKETDDFDTEKIDVDDGVDEIETEAFETEVISSIEEDAHQVFDEMSERELEDSNLGKRKLPVVMKMQMQKSKCWKHEGFKDALNRVLKMVCKEDDNDDGADINFVESAKMRGLIFPCPRWWPVEGFKD
ncbi:hypothetical protein QVD17_38346 [Tagetes erecta]|uniref:Uncharacterized protein n=1 Tax=Tagetes erecta TaxID=13708 RepID=A0AAD8JNR2_TARER|nr:hypothetical protein QVD17_38346 [Tagetes erecta]